MPSGPLGSGVGRGWRSIAKTRKPACSSRDWYSAGEGKKEAAAASLSMPCGARVAESAVRMAAILPWPPHFGDQAAAGAEGAVEVGEGCRLVGSGNPVEGGIREDGIEGVGRELDGMRGGGLDRGERQGGSAGVEDGEAASASGFDHGGGAVDAGQLGAGGGKGFGESAVAAADVEDALPGLGVEQGDDGGGEVGDEAAVPGVAIGLPALAGFVGVGKGGWAG